MPAASEMDEIFKEVEEMAKDKELMASIFGITSENDDSEITEEDYNMEDFDEDEEQGKNKYSVEEYKLTVVDVSNNPQTLTITHFVQKDGEFPWMRTMVIVCKNKGEVIGSGHGHLIDRNNIRSRFWELMQEPSEETSQLAFSLFDRFGILKKEFKDHCIRKGTGVWSNELDDGRIFLFERLSIHKDWRRKGLGTSMAQSLIQKAENYGGKGAKSTMLFPGWLHHDMDELTNGMSKDEAFKFRLQKWYQIAAFWRSLGFRRIGASDCFGLLVAKDNAPSKLLASADYDTPDCSHEDEDTWKDTKPLLHAIRTLPDTDCDMFFTQAGNGSTAVGQLEVTDNSGNTLLHIAASRSMILTIRHLLQLEKESVLQTSMNQMRNFYGYTPLEELQALLEGQRVSTRFRMLTVCTSDQFTGYPIKSVLCLEALCGVDRGSEESDRLRFGCTCGKCLAGFMSPKMKFVLLTQAEILYDSMSDMLGDDELGELQWDDMIEHVLCRTGSTIKRKLKANRAMRIGYSDAFKLLAHLLRVNKLPGPNTLLSLMQQSHPLSKPVKRYLDNGGTFMHVFQALIDNAKEQDEMFGDGATLAIFSDELNALPACRNDHEFGLVENVLKALN